MKPLEVTQVLYKKSHFQDTQLASDHTPLYLYTNSNTIRKIKILWLEGASFCIATIPIKIDLQNKPFQ